MRATRVGGRKTDADVDATVAGDDLKEEAEDAVCGRLREEAVSFEDDNGNDRDHKPPDVMHELSVGLVVYEADPRIGHVLLRQRQLGVAVESRLCGSFAAADAGNTGRKESV